jgi:hypothetical protein
MCKGSRFTYFTILEAENPRSDSPITLTFGLITDSIMWKYIQDGEIIRRDRNPERDSWVRLIL